MTASRKYALITGCSEGGMGWYLAREFANRGVHTFATLRTASKIGGLGSHANIEVLELDVTSTVSVKTCVEIVKERTGGRLDYLYNNAGAQLIMPIADQDVNGARHLFDTNVWSILEVTQAFLPLLVEARGFVANAGSIRGYLAQEFDGIYGMTKIAVTLMTQNMRIEFAPLGVKVAIVHIGKVETQIYQNQATYKAVTLPENSYYHSINSQVSHLATDGRGKSFKATLPDAFAKKVVGDIFAGRTTIRRGLFATLTGILTHLLPGRLLESMTLGSDSGLPMLAKEMEAKRRSNKRKTH